MLYFFVRKSRKRSKNRMMDVMATQGAKIRRYRRARGYTQRQLAAAAGFSERTIVMLESDRSEARPSTLTKLAEALRVDPLEIMGDEEPEV
jgi:transcriptional regulator with XRE-family HTH domain